MFNRETRAPRVDVKTMYPNFHAEQYKHHVQENTSMSVTNKRRDGSGGTRRDGLGASSRSPSRNGLLQSKQRVGHRQSEDDISTRRQPSAERSRRAIPPIAVSRSSNQQEGVSSALPGMMASSLRPSSRQVALRGELSLSSPAWEDDNNTNGVGISPRLRPLSFPTALAGSARSLLEATTARLANSVEGESLQDFVINARPRTRHARRELHRQGTAPTLARISTAPMTLHGRQSLDGTTPLASSRSTGTLHSAGDLSRRAPSRQAVHSAAVHTIEAVLPQTDVDDDTDDDDTNFFLTELEAAARTASAVAAVKLHVLARHVALASFLLYGNPPALVAALQHVMAALKSLEGDTVCAKSNSPAGLALMSLLHHHQGVAIRELVVASTLSTSKVAMACIKHAFTAQQRALELAKRAQDPRLQARAVKTLGLLLLDAHAYGPALTHQQEALQIALEEKDCELEARVYANLGNLALAQLNFGHALSCHHRDLQLCSSKSLDCRLGRARAHRNLAIIYAKLHRRDQQIRHEKEARMAQYNDGGAYLNDIANHADSSAGNICLQSTTDIDPALVNLVTQNLAEIVRGLSAQRNRGFPKESVDNDSITAVLEQEWSTAQVDLQAAIAIVSPQTAALLTEGGEFITTYTTKPPSKAALSRHVSIRIDNYSSAAGLDKYNMQYNWTR